MGAMEASELGSLAVKDTCSDLVAGDPRLGVVERQICAGYKVQPCHGLLECPCAANAPL